jgi:hypothetical protein
MKQLSLVLLIVSSQVDLSSALGKYEVILSETYEDCSPKGRNANALDLSNFELIATSATNTVINGTIKILRDFKNASIHVFAEKNYRSTWHKELFEAKRPSFCESWRSPKEVWYTRTKNLRGCPLGAGVSIKVMSCGLLGLL